MIADMVILLTPETVLFFWGRAPRLADDSAKRRPGPVSAEPSLGTWIRPHGFAMLRYGRRTRAA